jgi:esterase/lipase superfamily enzyme
MRLSLYLAAATAMALTGCVYPRPDIVVENPEQCEVAGTPAAADLLFATERMPDCATGLLKVTDLRGSQVMFGAVAADRTVHFYHADDWWAELHRRLEAGRAPLLFIHGYNNSNQDALTVGFAIRTAVGPGREVIALTWPSYAELKKYWWDETNADWATDETGALISDFASRGYRTTIVAHSMGNRIALEALMRMPQADRSAAIQRLVMASADVDRAKAIREVPKLGIPVTLYASTRDQALAGSWRDHGLPRAGDLSTWYTGHTPDPGAILNTDGLVDVVDTSAVTRGIVHHTDYIGTPEGATDLCRAVRGDHDPVNGRTMDPTQRRWLLLKGEAQDPSDPCVGSGFAAAKWYPE